MDDIVGCLEEHEWDDNDWAREALYQPEDNDNVIVEHAQAKEDVVPRFSSGERDVAIGKDLMCGAIQNAMLSRTLGTKQ